MEELKRSYDEAVITSVHKALQMSHAHVHLLLKRIGILESALKEPSFDSYPHKVSRELR
jgi:hypothetical protein